MRSLALSDVTEGDLAAMLHENETLFVEHKTALREDARGFQVAKAVCSFANSLGGWVLIGVTDGEPNAGADGGWEPVAAYELTDRVRDVLLTNRVDPMPPFAASVKSVGPNSTPIGVVRVYESADAPHVMASGQVFVRSVAQDVNLGRVYRPGGVETQAALLSLVERGRRGVGAAEKRIRDPFAPRFAPEAVGMQLSVTGGLRVGGPTFVLKAAPVTAPTFADWAVSWAGREALISSIRELAGVDDDIEPELGVDAVGLRALQRTVGQEAAGAVTPESGTVRAAVDRAGVVAVSRTLGLQQPPLPKLEWTLDQLKERIVGPLVCAAAQLLEASGSLGRTVLTLELGATSDVLCVRGGDQPATLPMSLRLDGDFTLPADPAELDAVAARWIEDLGRSAGLETLRDGSSRGILRP